MVLLCKAFFSVINWHLAEYFVGHCDVSWDVIIFVGYFLGAPFCLLSTSYIISFRIRSQHHLSGAIWSSAVRLSSRFLSLLAAFSGIFCGSLRCLLRLHHFCGVFFSVLLFACFQRHTSFRLRIRSHYHLSGAIWSSAVRLSCRLLTLLAAFSGIFCGSLRCLLKRHHFCGVFFSVLLFACFQRHTSFRFASARSIIYREQYGPPL